MNNHTNQSQLTNDTDFTLDSITVTMTNQSTCYNKFSLFTVRLSNCCLLKKTAISYKKKMDEKPIRQSSLVVLQVLCVKLKCLVQLESAVIHHQVLLGRGSRKRWKQSRLIFHIINSSKGNNFCQIQSKKGGSCIQFGLQKFQKKGNVLSRIQFLHVIYSERIWKLRVYIYLYIVFRIKRRKLLEC